jgi:hypothetical protein
MSMLWFVVLMQVLASWYLAVMVLMADALFALYLVVWLRLSRGVLLKMAGQVVVGAAAGAAVVWPIARHYLALVELNGEKPAEAIGYSLGVRDIFVPPLNTWLGQWMVRHGSTAPAWIWGEKTLYLGYVTIALAMGGLLRARWPRYRKERYDSENPDEGAWLAFFGLLGALALMLALGPSPAAVAAGSFDPSPFGLMSTLPGMSLFRVPGRFVQLATLALAMLAAAGAHSVHARFGRRGQAAIVLLLPFMLGEWYLVDFPGGPPQPERIPAVYRQLAVLPAHAVVSLPDYIGGPEWFFESDYQYYSTAHWHPILNGYARTEPPGYRERMARISTFPSHDCAQAMREVAADYVVFHASRYAAGAAAERIDRAKSGGDFELVGRSGSDYLYRVR